jgi:hypothetical protein
LTNTSSPVSAPTSNSSNTSGIAVIATLPVSNGAFRLAYDSSQGEIFVVNGANTLPESVISDNTNAVNAGASGEGANFVAYDSGKNDYSRPETAITPVGLFLIPQDRQQR